MIAPFEYCKKCGLVYCHIQNIECVVCHGDLEPIEDLLISEREETIPIAQLENLLGYLELDLENRELDNKSSWEETYNVVAVWLDKQRSLTKRALDGANCPVCGEPMAAAALHEFCYQPNPPRK